MTETFLAFDLKVTCLDGSQHEGVELKIVDETVIYSKPDGTELKGDTAVTMIDAGSFLMPPNIVAQAIEQYRSQQ